MHYGRCQSSRKIFAWARTVPYTLRNPLYHWTHLELQRYFGITDLLDESSAPSVWDRANAALAADLTTHGILKKFGVEVVCTTDDPTDDLRHHRAIPKANLSTLVFPAFRPDKALAIRTPEFTVWLGKLSTAANIDIRDLNSLLDALRKRQDEFHSLGCRLSDHGLDYCFATPCSDQTAAAIFAKATQLKVVTDEEHSRFASFMMLFFARLDAEKDWTKQLLGALRNVNSAARQAIGADSGYDTVGDFPQIAPLAAYLDLLARENALPRMILYNNNPRDTFAFATLIGTFQSGDQTRQNSVWQCLVVFGPKGRNDRANQCSLQRWPALPFHWHGH